MTKAEPSNYDFLARVEWCQLIALAFSTQLVTPLIFVFSSYPGLFLPAAFQSLIEIAIMVPLYLAVIILVSFAFTTYRLCVVSVRPRAVPWQAYSRLKNALESSLTEADREQLDRIEVNTVDLSMGAHVMGVLRPRVVISAGLLVGLIRRDGKALAILVHEIAHVRHLDVLIPGLIGIVVLDTVGLPIRVFMDPNLEALNGQSLVAFAVFVFIYKLLVLGALIFFFSRRRELYADASAAQIVGEKTYLDLLNSAIGYEKERRSFFHPSLAQRVRALEQGFKSIKLAPEWRAYLSLSTVVNFLIWTVMDGDRPEVIYFFSTFCIGVVLLILEFFRPFLLQIKGQFAVRIPRTALRYLFLLVGFLGAISVGILVPTLGVLTPILGAGVYVIFRATR